MKTPGKCRNGGHIVLIPQEDIFPNKNQPRKSFDNAELAGLAESIRQNGIIQPLSVRITDEGYYELIAGERRLRAARMVGLSRIPCIIMQASDEASTVYALLENLQRQDLSFFEEALAIEMLITEFGMTQERVSRNLGKSQPAISNKLRLLKLPENIRRDIVSAGLTERHARALLSLENPEMLRKALDTIKERQLNVVQTERLVEQLQSETKQTKKAPLKLFKDIRIFVNTLDHAVDTMISAGIEAKSVKNETDDYIEYTVRIPKNRAFAGTVRKTS